MIVRGSPPPRCELFDAEVKAPLLALASSTAPAGARQGDHALFGQRSLATNDSTALLLVGRAGREFIELDPVGVIGPVGHMAAEDEAGPALAAHSDEVTRRQPIPAGHPHVLGVELGAQLFEIGGT